MIVSPAAAHARVTGPGGGSDTGSGTATGGGTGTGSVLRRCLARRGMLHSECEAVDQLVLPPHVGVEHLGRAGVDEAWFVLSGTVTVDECDSPPWTLHAGQLMLSPAGTRPTSGPAPRRRRCCSWRRSPTSAPPNSPRTPEILHD